MNASGSVEGETSLESRHEWCRRCCHIGPGILPFCLWWIPHPHPFPWLMMLLVLGLTCVLALIAFHCYSWIARRRDHNRVPVVIGYTASVLVMLVLFPRQPELGLTVLAILAFGDGMATVAGLLIGGPKLPWNPKKTLAGTCAFLLCGIPLATLIYWGEAQPRVAVPQALACAGGAALVGAIVESWRGPLNDNIRIGIASGATIALLQLCVVGY
jgi:dolichol kinase